MQNKFKNMLKLQQDLNDETNGFGWENGHTKEGKVINWYTCIYMESAELIDSFDWKHWKKMDNDWDNAKIELVDIFHFILSLMLVEDKDLESNSFKLDLLSAKFKLKDEDISQVIENARKIIHEASKEEPDLGKIIVLFFTLCEGCRLSLDELYKLYMGKNVLNKFRQDRGYKEGTYIKTWLHKGEEKEDNEVLKELLDEGLDLGKLYRSLDESYVVALHARENKDY